MTLLRDKCTFDETICGEQNEVFRLDLPKSKAAMVQFQKSALVVKPGQRWEPTQDKVDEYLARCDEICHLVPRDLDELSFSQGC